MATRNLTSKFEALRGRRSKPRIGLSTDDGEDGARTLLDGGSTSDQDRDAIRVGLEHVLPPEWVDIVETIQKDIKTVKDNRAFS